MSNLDGDIEPRSCPTCKRTPVPSGPFDDCACGHKWNEPATKAQGVPLLCRFCGDEPCDCDTDGPGERPLRPKSQADHIEAALAKLTDEAKCRDRVDQALQCIDDLEERGPVSFKALLKPLREILTGARDMKSIHSSGRKGPGFF